MQVNTIRWYGCMLILLAAVGCQCTGGTPGPAADDSPLCYEASPGVYGLVAENASFRVISATWDGGERDEWHSHPPLAAYFLTDVQGRLHYRDGSSKEVRGAAGDVNLLDGGETHYFENTAGAECRMVLFERVWQGIVPKPTEDASPACYDASPEVYKIIGENDLVRVILSTWEPGKRDDWHSHPPLAAYFLTEVQGRLIYQTGLENEISGNAGMAKLLGKTEKHAYENTSDAECRVVIVELK